MRTHVGLAIALFLTVTTLAAPAAAAALEPGPLRATRYDLAIRPEFDTTDVLVVNNATLTNTADTPFQGRIGFRVPKGAQLQMVCEIKPDGGHACQPFKSEDKGDSVEISWKATRAISKGDSFPIYVEYYYNPFTSRTPRKFTHRYDPVYPVDDLSVTITQPGRSTDFKLVPAASLSQPAKDGTVDWLYNLKNVPAQPLNFAVSYTKADDNPSVRLPKKPGGDQAASGGQAAPGGQSSTITLLTVLLAPIVIAGAFVFLAKGEGKSQRRR